MREETEIRDAEAKYLRLSEKVCELLGEVECCMKDRDAAFEAWRKLVDQESGDEAARHDAEE